MTRFDDLLRTGGALAGRVGSAALDAIASAHAPQPGATLGPYRIVREVGRGGMAVVFLAERADGQFNQQVALKWILALAASPATRELFRGERQILADLSHPNIARLIDGGETVDGQLWFAMQWIDGDAMLDWCRSHGTDLRHRVQLLLQVAAALRFAHARALVHCDIKSSNILVDAEGLAHLLDFGVARLTGSRDSGMATGHTPAVASPEQRAGLAAGIASDVYQLGLLLGELLGATTHAVAADEAGALGLRGQDRTFVWPEEVPPELRAIVSRATRHSADQRHESVAALADDASAWLARRPVRAYRIGFAYQARCFIRRNPALSIVSALSLLAMLGLTAAFAVRLADQRDQARAAAARAEAVSGFLVRMFRDVDPAANRVAADAARGLVQRGEAALADQLGDIPDVRAAVLATLAEVNQSLGDYASAERLARDSLASDPNPGTREWATRQALLAQALTGRGDYDGAVEVSSAALDAIAANTDLDEARTRLLAARANAAQLKGDLDLALGSAQELLRTAAAGRDGDELAAMAHLTLAYVAEQRGDFATALADAERARTALAAALGAEHARVAALDAYRAYLLLGVDRHADAERAADAAVAGLSRVYGGEHARLSYALTNQALARLRNGKSASARESGERALAMCRRVLSADHAQCAVSAQVLATIAEASGDHATALPLLRDVLRVRKATLRPDHAYIGYAQVSLASALCSIGDAAAARGHAAEAVRVLGSRTIDAVTQGKLDDLMQRCAAP